MAQSSGHAAVPAGCWWQAPSGPPTVTDRCTAAAGLLAATAASTLRCSPAASSVPAACDCCCPAACNTHQHPDAHPTPVQWCRVWWVQEPNPRTWQEQDNEVQCDWQVRGAAAGCQCDFLHGLVWQWGPVQAGGAPPHRYACSRRRSAASVLRAQQAPYTQQLSCISTAPTKKHHIGHSTGNHQQAFGAGCPLSAVLLHGDTRHLLGRMMLK